MVSLTNLFETEVYLPKNFKISDQKTMFYIEIKQSNLQITSVTKKLGYILFLRKKISKKNPMKKI